MNANLLRGGGEGLTRGIQDGFPDENYRVTEFLERCAPGASPSRTDFVMQAIKKGPEGPGLLVICLFDSTIQSLSKMLSLSW